MTTSFFWEWNEFAPIGAIAEHIRRFPSYQLYCIEANLGDSNEVIVAQNKNKARDYFWEHNKEIYLNKKDCPEITLWKDDI